LNSGLLLEQLGIQPPSHWGGVGAAVALPEADMLGVEPRVVAEAVVHVTYILVKHQI
jgi:hypothetical protein